MSNVLKTTVRTGAEDAIRERKDFVAGALSGKRPTMGGEVGKLPVEWRDLLHLHSQGVGVDYIVYSYSTPIAWVTADGEVCMPDRKYSVTTSKHQSIVRRALLNG